MRSLKKSANWSTTSEPENAASGLLPTSAQSTIVSAIGAASPATATAVCTTLLRTTRSSATTSSASAVSAISGESR